MLLFLVRKEANKTKGMRMKITSYNPPPFPIWKTRPGKSPGLMWIAILMSVCLSWTVHAQVTVGGTVTDPDDEPLIGVNVQIKGTNKGTATDFDGKYQLEEVSEDASLIFSYIGYQTTEIPVGGQSVIDVSLTPDAALLEEVVVVGYGTQQRESVTGSVSQVSGRELLKTPSGNISNKLGGVVPGVISLQQSGQPGVDGASI